MKLDATNWKTLRDSLNNNSKRYKLLAICTSILALSFARKAGSLDALAWASDECHDIELEDAKKDD